MYTFKIVHVIFNFYFSEMLQKLMTLYNINLSNSYGDNETMLSLKKQNVEALEGMLLLTNCSTFLNSIFNLFLFLVDCDLSTEYSNSMTNPEDMCVVAIGNGSGDQSEDSSITDSERYGVFISIIKNVFQI